MTTLKNIIAPLTWITPVDQSPGFMSAKALAGVYCLMQDREEGSWELTWDAYQESFHDEAVELGTFRDLNKGKDRAWSHHSELVATALLTRRDSMATTRT